MIYLTMLAFISGVLYDAVWTLCVNAVAKHKPLMAANMSVLIFGCTALSTVLIIDSKWVPLSAFVLGSWSGTFIAVKWWMK